VNLPNGQVLTTGGSSDWLYTPDSLPQDAWRPAVSSVTFNSGTTYTLTGTQLSGLINGGDEGDDMTSAENYPIVWLTDNANHVYYCKSFNFSNMTPSKGSTPENCQFTTPAGLASGTYNLFVSAVGVQSKVAFSFTTGESEDAGPDAATGTVADAATGSDASTGGSDASGGTTGMEAGNGLNDAGAMVEGGAASDATTSDATAASDGGVTPGLDATSFQDGATVTGSDAGSGSNDSGQVATTEGGASDAAAPNSGNDSGFGDSVGNSPGCGCSTVGDSSSPGQRGRVALSALIGLAVIARRRRRRCAALVASTLPE
jgi:MYXO-CTERM domain-containing protein